MRCRLPATLISTPHAWVSCLACPRLARPSATSSPSSRGLKFTPRPSPSRGRCYESSSPSPRLLNGITRYTAWRKASGYWSKMAMAKISFSTISSFSERTMPRPSRTSILWNSQSQSPSPCPRTTLSRSSPTGGCIPRRGWRCPSRNSSFPRGSPLIPNFWIFSPSQLLR